MVRFCPLITAIVSVSSVVQALPAAVQVTNGERAESESDYMQAQLNRLTTAIQQVADAPPPATATPNSGLNRNAAYAGAAIMGVVGALLGGTIGAYMPPNTTFTVNSILQGLTYELEQINKAMDTAKEDKGLSIITSLIPALGSIIAQQPNLARGPKGSEGPFIAPPPPPGYSTVGKAGAKGDGMSVVPLPKGIHGMEMGKPKDGMPKSADGMSVVPIPNGVMGVEMGKPKDGMPKSAEGMSVVPIPNGVMGVELGKPKDGQATEKPKGVGSMGTDMAPPPAPGPPRPTTPSAEAKTPGTTSPIALVGSDNPKATATFTFPGLEDVAPASMAAAAAAPPLAGTGMSGGHSHGGRRRRM